MSRERARSAANSTTCDATEDVAVLDEGVAALVYINIYIDRYRYIYMYI